MTFPQASTSSLGSPSSPALFGITPGNMVVVEFGKTVASYGGDRLTSATLTKSITQASTLALAFDDPKRELVGLPILNQAVTIDTGANPPVRFKLVQVSKAGNILTATYEDALIAKLRKVTGQLASAPGVTTRTQFAQQLCREAGIPSVVPSSVPPVNVPLTRGTSQAPLEDSWTCLTRIAQDVKYRCFSDGSSIWFGPDSWLFGYPPVMQIAEYTDAVDTINFDYDVGKPVAKATVATYDRAWKANAGAPVNVLNLAAASGKWIVESIGRDLYKSATSVALVQPQPSLPEPPAPAPTTTPGATKTVTFQAKAK